MCVTEKINLTVLTTCGEAYFEMDFNTDTKETER